MNGAHADPSAVWGIVAFVLLLFGVVLLIARRGRPLVLELGKSREPVPTESGGPGGSLEAEVALLTSGRDTVPVPDRVPHEPCRVCPARATRMMPASGRGQRMAHAGALALGAGVEMDHHADRLYGQPRPEIIHTGPGSELCETHELVAFRLLENFHAGQRARLSTLNGTLALEAASFEGGGLMHELQEIAKSHGKAKARR